MISTLFDDDASPGTSRPPPVLVVDDQTAALTTIDVLAAGGYPATNEADGDAVLRHVRAALVRFVVSELYVTCAEGPCVVRVLKGERTRLPRLRVLIYTRHEQERDVEWALATGCDALVLKSAMAGVLLREVARLDGAWQSPRRN